MATPACESVPPVQAGVTKSAPVKDSQLLVQFRSAAGDLLASPLNVPLSITVQNLQRVCNALLENDPPQPYSFFVEERRVTDCLSAALPALDVSRERVLEIVYEPEAKFRVQAVTRCTGQMSGHAEAVLAVQFSPDGRLLASGSGDCTLQLWQPLTETPSRTCRGHRHWVLCVSWSPDGSRVASGCRGGEVRLWQAETGQQHGITLAGHRQWITQVCWRPLAAHPADDPSPGSLLASASKDGDVRVWHAGTARCYRVLSGHTRSVTGLRWAGSDRVYSCSQDRSVRVWCPHSGSQLQCLLGHGHWINTLALSTDHVLRTGSAGLGCELNSVVRAREHWESVVAASGGEERLVTGSDDFTMILWRPDRQTTPTARLTGHQQLINAVCFSPDARWLASASFDKSVRLWRGATGDFVAALRGHVQAVYTVAWSADSRLLVTASADSTLKVWSVSTRSLLIDLPGHADQVYAVDWSADGERVASGGKDTLVRVWRR